jgi:hypothetical protein
MILKRINYKPLGYAVEKRDAIGSFILRAVHDDVMMATVSVESFLIWVRSGRDVNLKWLMFAPFRVHGCPAIKLYLNRPIYIYIYICQLHSKSRIVPICWSMMRLRNSFILICHLQTCYNITSLPCSMSEVPYGEEATSARDNYFLWTQLGFIVLYIEPPFQWESGSITMREIFSLAPCCQMQCIYLSSLDARDTFLKIIYLHKHKCKCK